MARKKEFKDVRQLLAENLEKAYERWDLLYKNGGSDPFWCDGTNLNLVRNHILYYREQCEEVLEPKDYPEAYHKELPPVVPDDYMAKKGFCVSFGAVMTAFSRLEATCNGMVFSILSVTGCCFRIGKYSFLRRILRNATSSLDPELKETFKAQSSFSSALFTSGSFSFPAASVRVR